MTALLDLGRRRAGAPGSGDEPPDPDTVNAKAVMIASEGRLFSNQAIALATRLSERSGAPVHVLAIARIWGASFGFPNPGLYPNKNEWEERRSMVQRVVWGLERKGIEVDGRVFGARNATKRITREARRLGCDAIVMSADEPRNRFVGNFMWSQEPQRVQRRADVPVFLVIEP